MADYVDLLITDDDVTLDPAGEPLLVFDRDCITQDVRHAIRDSGLLVQAVGERDSNRVAQLLLQLTLIIEADERLVPGTVRITREQAELFFVTADTYLYGPLQLSAGGT